MRSRVVLALIPLVAAIGGACGSFEAADEPPPTDGGIDSAIDVGPVDAAVSDTSLDGSGDATAPRFCDAVAQDAGSVVYCRDFDDGIGADQQWNSVTLTGGSVALDSNERVSKPSSLKARVEPTVDTCLYAQPHRELGNLPSHTRIAFDVRVGGGGTSASEGSSYFSVGIGACILILSSNQTKGIAHLQNVGMNEDTFPEMVAAYPRPEVWAHVETSIDLAAGQVGILVDGSPALEDGAITLFPSCLSETTPKLVLSPGIHCEAPSASPREVHVDNIVVTAF